MRVPSFGGASESSRECQARRNWKSDQAVELCQSRGNTKAFERLPSASLFEWLVRAQVVAEVYLARARDFLLGVEQHLFPLGDPAAGAGDGEQYGEHRYRETHRLVDQAGIKIDVGIELAGDEVVVLEGDALAFESDVQQRIAAHDFEYAVRHALDDARARVVIFVHAVAEAHELRFAGLHAL